MMKIFFSTLCFLLIFSLSAQDIPSKILEENHRTIFEQEEKISLPKCMHTLLGKNMSIYTFSTERSVYTQSDDKKFYRKIVMLKSQEQNMALEFSDKIFYGQDTYSLTYQIAFSKNNNLVSYTIAWEKEQDGFSPENMDKMAEHIYQYADKLRDSLKKEKQVSHILKDLGIIGMPFESYKDTIGCFFRYPKREIVNMVVGKNFEWSDKSGWPPPPAIREMSYTILTYHSAQLSNFYNVVSAKLKVSGAGTKVAMVELESATYGGGAHVFRVYGQATFSMQK